MIILTALMNYTNLLLTFIQILVCYEFSFKKVSKITVSQQCSYSHHFLFNFHFSSGMNTFSTKEYKTRIACCKTSNHHNSVPDNTLYNMTI